MLSKGTEVRIMTVHWSLRNKTGILLEDAYFGADGSDIPYVRITGTGDITPIAIEYLKPLYQVNKSRYPFRGNRYYGS